jgi:fatty acid desaturase
MEVLPRQPRAGSPAVFESREARLQKLLAFSMPPFSAADRAQAEVASSSAHIKTGLVRELEEVKDKILAETVKNGGKEDIAHLQKLQISRFVLLAFGLATAWYAVNPVSSFAISLFRFMSWAMCAHHILHRGYDKVPNIPAKWTSKNYAKGLNRWIDFPDWIEPKAWVEEHNTLHHYKLGETHDTRAESHSVGDPDIVEVNTEVLRGSKLPKIFKYIYVFALASVWKFAYYAPQTLHARLSKEMEKKEEGSSQKLGRAFDFAFMQPFSSSGWLLWTQCFLPYIAINFVAIPGVFFVLLGHDAARNVLINMLIAEVMTNLHSFAAIVTNHAGDDLHRYSEKHDSSHPLARHDFYCRQIMGSVNFNCGGDIIDTMHGWLNYQIEHHVWPDMTMLQYQRAQPLVKAICQKYRVSYVQQSVWTRVVKTVNIMVGDETMINVCNAHSFGRD